MSGQKRMLEDLRLEPLLRSGVNWSLEVDGVKRPLKVLRPHGDSLEEHLQWIVVEPHGRGWYPGPDVLLTDGIEYLVVLEAKREDTSSHSGACHDAIRKALGYSIQFDQLRQRRPPRIWVGTRDDGLLMDQAFGLLPGSVLRMSILPGLLGLGPVRGRGLRLLDGLRDVFQPGAIFLPPTTTSWQRALPADAWRLGHRQFRRWAIAEQVPEGAKEVTLRKVVLAV